jgi:ubiquinone/menaquinone biosynthesis C-methylase UbiE
VKRIVESELMEDEAQAIAYASADFDEPHSRFIELFRESFPDFAGTGRVIDLGCGPGDIAIRFARAFPRCIVHGVDGSTAMLRIGQRLLDRSATNVHERVQLIQGLLPDATMPLPRYDAIISNSLLRQLHEPQTLWRSVQRFAAPGAAVFVMDLRRPATFEEAERLRAKYVSSEPEVLQQDFFNSLLAAFEPEEINAQRGEAGLSHLDVRSIGDRHVVISGVV